ncbi:MAG: IclR family transcriptional regulator [Tissierellia bacterium]|nr:IclR family transcriptional regulator [Tissierellia bacterium]
MSKAVRIQSIERAIRILNCFSEKRRELGLTELSLMLDLNKSTLHGIVSTLKEHGFMDQDPETQKYRLGLKLAELGNIVQQSMDIVRISKPYIDHVSEILEETVHIAVLDGKEVIYLEKKESYQSMRIMTNIGARNVAYTTGVGKVILAYLEPEELENHLPETLISLTPHTISNRDALITELQRIREQGYGMDNEENVLGLTCVAAPIFDKGRVIRYGLSVSGPSVRMTPEKVDESIRLVKEAASKITDILNFSE